MKVDVFTNDKHPKGIAVTFPWAPDSVEQIKKVVGFDWDPKRKCWHSMGPEVLLDMQRFDVSIDWMSGSARAICEAFRDNLWKLSDIRAEPFGPEKFSFQKQGTEFLAHQAAAVLADDMGTGKTKQAIDALAQIEAKRVLVVCLKTVCYNWENEFRKWHPEMDVAVVPDAGSGKDRAVVKDFWKTPYQVTIANYEKLITNSWPDDAEWDVVILDEAPLRMKSSSSQTYRAVRKQTRFAEHVWILTGTPLEKKLDELYTMFALLRPAVFGNYGRFRHHHLDQDWSGKVSIKNLTLLRERLGPWQLRRTEPELKQQLQLPDKLPPVDHIIKMSPAEDKSYKELVKDFDSWLATRNVFGDNGGMVRTVRMRQFCCTPAIFNDVACGRGSKYEALLEQLKEWEGRAVVFCYYKEALKLLAGWLAKDLGHSYHQDAWISGDTSAQERFRRCEEFNTGRLGKVFLSTDAGGVGINLYGADLVVHYDQIWNAQRMRQREGRLHRPGQTRDVHVFNMLMKGSIDEGMRDANLEEEQLFKDVIDGAEDVMIRKLSPDRLARMVRGSA